MASHIFLGKNPRNLPQSPQFINCSDNPSVTSIANGLELANSSETHSDLLALLSRVLFIL